MANPLAYSNAIAGVLAATRSNGEGAIAATMPTGVAEGLAVLGHSAHRAQEAHELHLRMMEVQRGFLGLANQARSNRRDGDVLLPEGYQEIEAGYESATMNTVAPKGYFPLALFYELFGVAGNTGRDDPAFAKYQAVVALLAAQKSLDSIPSDERARVFYGLGVAAEQGFPDGLKIPWLAAHLGAAFRRDNVPMSLELIFPGPIRFPWVADFFYSQAAGLGSTAAASARERIAATHDVVSMWKDWKEQAVRVPLVHPGHYELILLNEGIAPQKFLFEFRSDQSLAGRGMSVSVPHAEGAQGMFLGMMNLGAAASEVLQAVTFTGRWDYQMSSAGGDVTNRSLKLLMRGKLQLPFMAPQPFHQKIEASIVGTNGIGLYGVNSDGNEVLITEVLPPELQPPR